MGESMDLGRGIAMAVSIGCTALVLSWMRRTGRLRAAGASAAVGDRRVAYAPLVEGDRGVARAPWFLGVFALVFALFFAGLGLLALIRGEAVAYGAFCVLAALCYVAWWVDTRVSRRIWDARGLRRTRMLRASRQCRRSDLRGVEPRADKRDHRLDFGAAGAVQVGEGLAGGDALVAHAHAVLAARDAA